MKVEYFGHSSFLFTAHNGLTLLTDPYDPTVGYRPHGRHADVTLVSHDHWDHNYIHGVKGRTHVLTGARQHEVGEDFRVRGVLAAHDAEQGNRFGFVTLFCWTMDGVRVAFLSDLGHVLSEAQVREIGPVDVLLVPVGGHYTLDAVTARTVVRQFPAVRVVIPMHYMTASLKREKFPIQGVDGFLSGYSTVRQERSGSVDIDKLPETLQILALTPMY